MILPVKRYLLPVFIVVLFIGAYSTANAEEEGSPIHVKTGIYITDIHSLDIRESTFKVTFWAWFLYAAKEYNPAKTLDVTNAMAYQISSADVTTGDSQYPFWASMKINAVIRKDYDLSNFPFDRQVLDINFEDMYDVTRMKIEPDLKNSLVDPDIHIDGWEIEKFEFIGATKTYHTAFGNPILNADSKYTRTTARISVRRNGMKLFISMIIVAVIGFLLSYLSIVLPPKEMGPKFSLAMCAVAAIVGAKYGLDLRLPPTSGMTLVDKTLILIFCYVLLNVIFNVVTTCCVSKNNMAAAEKFSKVALIFVPLLFLITVVLLFVFI